MVHRDVPTLSQMYSNNSKRWPFVKRIIRICVCCVYECLCLSILLFSFFLFVSYIYIFFFFENTRRQKYSWALLEKNFKHILFALWRPSGNLDLQQTSSTKFDRWTGNCVFIYPIQCGLDRLPEVLYRAKAVAICIYNSWYWKFLKQNPIAIWQFVVEYKISV